MMHWTFFSDQNWDQLYPFGFSHQKGQLRWGGLTLLEQWNQLFESSLLNDLQLNGSDVQQGINKCLINDRWIPNAEVAKILQEIKPGQNVSCGSIALISWSNPLPQQDIIEWEGAELIEHPTDIFLRCGDVIQQQWDTLRDAWKANTATEAILPSHVTVIGDISKILVAPGARVLASTLNTEAGPILIGPDAEIQEGCHVRGPFLLDQNSILKMGSKVYGPVVIGPRCHIGGEVSSSVFLGYSNKGHDGFVGHSVIGHWCNLGAGTNTSNLKNNYSTVSLWSPAKQTMQPSRLLFCGLIMGDHSKCGINTMFNTGTTVGPGCNIFGGTFPPKNIPPFSWGGDGSWSTHQFDRFVDTARSVKARRDEELTADELSAWETCFEETKSRHSPL
jgi:UDP-N-acetylglucosamine diphosphorylase/glucosamine-1-phosphate N-acetyltransferase